jgi:hypothetical protein
MEPKSGSRKILGLGPHHFQFNFGIFTAFVMNRWPLSGAELQCYDWGQLTPMPLAQTPLCIGQYKEIDPLKLEFDPSQSAFIQSIHVYVCAVQAQNRKHCKPRVR